MTIRHRIKQLERKAGLNQPIKHAPLLLNPSKKEIERACREYPGALLFIVDIGLPPKKP